jgi:integrase
MKRYQPIDLSQVAEDRRDVLVVTFPELLDVYCAAKHGKRPELREYRLRKWRAQFACIPAWEMTPAHVAAMVSAMEEQEYAPTSVNRDVADIASCYGWAIRLRHAPADFQNPCREFVRRKDTPRRVELREQQQKALLTAAKLSHWPKLFPLVLTALHTGGRKSELMRLSWRDVDFAARRAVLNETKAGVPRRLLLTEPVVAALQAIQPAPCPDDSLVFCGRNPFTPHDFRKAWEKCRKDAGLPEMHFHDLRHASAAKMLKAGNGLHSVAQVLGHRDTRMLSRVYGHLDDGHLQNMVEASWGREG